MGRKQVRLPKGIQKELDIIKQQNGLTRDSEAFAVFQERNNMMQEQIRQQKALESQLRSLAEELNQLLPNDRRRKR